MAHALFNLLHELHSERLRRRVALGFASLLPVLSPVHQRNNVIMTWIKTVSTSADEKVRTASEAQRDLYPIEYATPVHPTLDGESAGIVQSHSLIPDALFHAFATYGSLLSPDLPLQRRQHEMIATIVSVTNRCHY